MRKNSGIDFTRIIFVSMMAIYFIVLKLIENTDESWVSIISFNVGLSILYLLAIKILDSKNIH